jgi:pimeloyl-ACP methyl ester carboxylesterase
MRIARAALALGLLAAAPAFAAPREDAVFETSDGFTLHADLFRAPDARAPVAILLHQFNADRRGWGPLVPALSEAGFTVLALDQRGQGESKAQRTDGGSQRLDVRALASQDRAAVGPIVRAGVGDVKAALAFLAARGVATERVVLVGSSYGCSVALLAAAELPAVRGLALLSPGAAYFGVEVTEPAARFAGTLAMFAAEDDAASAESVRRFVQRRGKPDEATVFPSGGHGLALLSAHGDLPGRIAQGLARAAGR